MSFQPHALLLAAGLALIGAAAPSAAHAQINVTINSAPPVVVGAPANAQYYYIPEANAYYDVPAHRYLVQHNGRWERYERLEGYDPRSFHPQYIDYRGAEPWTYKAHGNPHGLPPGQAKKLYRSGLNDHGKHDHDYRGHGRG